MHKFNTLITIFLFITVSLSGQVGPGDKNIITFLGNAADYNIQLIGDDEKMYSLPTGFLKDKLDKNFDYLLPSRLSAEYNYLVITHRSKPQPNSGCELDEQYYLIKEARSQESGVSRLFV